MKTDDKVASVTNSGERLETGAAGRRKRRLGKWGICAGLGCTVLTVAAWQVWGAEAHAKKMYEEYFVYLIPPFWDVNDVGFRESSGHFAGLAREGKRIILDHHESDFSRGGISTNGGSTRVSENAGMVQTWLRSGPDSFAPAVFLPVKSDGPVERVSYGGRDHCGVDLEREAADFNIGAMKPVHVQYISGCCGYKMEDYWIAYGSFGDGDGDGLPAGTGTAVLWFQNKAVHGQGRLKWERYRPLRGCREQVVFASGDEYKGDPKAPNRCYIPPTAELLSEDRAVFERALQTLRKCGWK